MTVFAHEKRLAGHQLAHDGLDKTPYQAGLDLHAIEPPSAMNLSSGPSRTVSWP